LTATSPLTALFHHVAQTGDFTVRVSVTYMVEQSNPAGSRWFWAYHIRIENHGPRAAQLLTRHWEISDARGAINIVDGEGVIGEQPVIKPGESYDYVSGCPLTTAAGSMIGHYEMQGSDGAHFLIEIPEFALRAPVIQS
jgi:ApaG protein